MSWRSLGRIYRGFELGATEGPGNARETMPRMNGSAATADGYGTRVLNMDDLKQARERRASSARHPSEEPEARSVPAFWEQEDPFNESRRWGRRNDAPPVARQAEARDDVRTEGILREDIRRKEVRREGVRREDVSRVEARRGEGRHDDDRQDQSYDWRLNRGAGKARPRTEDARRDRQSSREDSRRGQAGRSRQESPRGQSDRMRRGGWNEARQESAAARWEFEFKPRQQEAGRSPRQGEALRNERAGRYARRPEEAPRQGREQAYAEPESRSHTGLYVLFLMLALVVLGYVIMMKAFAVRTIDVSGNQTVTSQSVIALSGINPGQNIFMADLSLAKQNIESDPLLEVLGISRVLPDKIEIKIKQRIPHGAIAYLDGYVIIDENGTVLDVRDSLPVGQYPLVTGIEIQPSEKGKKVQGLNGNVLKSMYSVLSALYNGKAMQYVSTVSMADPGDITMFTGEGIKIDVGSATDLAKKAQWIACTVPELRSHGYTSGTLYVTGTDSPVFSGTDDAGGTSDQQGNADNAQGGDSDNAA